MTASSAVNISPSDSSTLDSVPLISVLIPSYNHQEYVIDCLESIKNSTYPRLELVLSDDCSGDATYELAKVWIDLYADRFEQAIAIRQPRNLGLVKNLQFLFNNCRGTYLAYLASDDLLVPSGISDRLRVFGEGEDIDAVFGNCQLISESGAVIRDRFLAPHISETFASEKFLLCALIRFWGPAGPSMMLRRTAILEAGSLGHLPEDLHFEDRYIYIRLAAQRKLRFTNCVVAKYRVVEHSMHRSTSFAVMDRKGVLASDEKNRHLLKGVNRLFLEMEIAKSRVALDKHINFITLTESVFWTISSGLLWRALYQWSRLSRKDKYHCPRMG